MRQIVAHYTRNEEKSEVNFNARVGENPTLLTPTQPKKNTDPKGDRRINQPLKPVPKKVKKRESIIGETDFSVSAPSAEPLPVVVADVQLPPTLSSVQ